ncbi:hypothetical protein AJ80_08764 [Polytolypa hystricis UAMH7299]|uniref:DUF3752 domain-containing protein n=1 Tax=Polytolypa hystricis (strain UAMH7299) TaxID=1447883 RepID=A0A2B7WUD2_POLH7|nr:hypothetical protein AJ80_08764 [Polytolypa hystricis UAMH7299]
MMSGPILPKDKRKRHSVDDEPAVGPQLPHPVAPSSPDTSNKKQRTVGPTLPPFYIAAQSNELSDDGSGSESDDDYGPSLPSAGSALPAATSDVTAEAGSKGESAEKPNTPHRDDWMLRPPDQSDWSSRVDPTKLRNRKFNTSSRAPTTTRSGQSNTGTWTETPEEKRKRLEAEVMGIQAPAATAGGPQGPEIRQYDAEMAKKVQGYNEKSRNTALYAQHQGTRSKGDEDDPSARPFDKEKDIRGSIKINNAQRREMVNRASDFGSRFSGGKFL